MNKNNNRHLLTLMRLKANLLSTNVADRVRESMSKDVKLAQRWNLLNECWNNSSIHPERDFDSPLDEETIGAFIEGGLNDDQSMAIEKQAWKSKALLCELAATFNFLYARQNQLDSAPIDQSFAENIVKMVNGISSQLSSFADFPAADVNVEISTPEIVVASNKRPIYLALSLSLAILMMIAGLTGWLMFRSDRRDGNQTIANPVEERKEDDKQPDSIDPEHGNDQKLVDKGNTNSNNPHPNVNHSEDDKPQRLPEENLSPPENIANDRVAPEEFDDPFAPLPDPLPKTEDRMANHPANQPSVTSIPIKPVWLDVKGLLGVRDLNNQSMVGFDFVSEMTEEMNIVSLPGSWAEGTIEELGKIVVDADTEFHLSSQRIAQVDSTDIANATLVMKLLSGRVGLDELNTPSMCEIHIGNQKLPLEIKSDDTALSLDMYSGIAVLAVRRGKIDVNGKLINRGQVVGFRRGVAYDIKDAKPSFRWMDRPENTVKMSKELQNLLMSSNNLNGEIAKLKTDSDEDLRITANHWGLSLNPPAAGLVFTSANTDQWVVTFDWLLQQHRLGSQRRTVWASLSESTGNPGFVREIFSWSRMIAAKTMPRKVDTEKMLTNLNNEQLFVRFASARLLEICFGNPSGYSPDLPAQQRVRTAREWSSYIFKIIDNRK